MCSQIQNHHPASSLPLGNGKAVEEEECVASAKELTVNGEFPIQVFHYLMPGYYAHTNAHMHPQLKRIRICRKSRKAGATGGQQRLLKRLLHSSISVAVVVVGGFDETEIQDDYIHR